MHNNKGFTLLELLIAAAIIGVLAMMATQAFRVSSAEVRLRDSLVRARAVAIAGRRFKIEHPDASYNVTPMGIVQGGDLAGAVCEGNNLDISLSRLVHCGFLDFRRYVEDTDFIMQFKNDGSVCVTPNINSKVKVLCNNGNCPVTCTDGETEFPN